MVSWFHFASLDACFLVLGAPKGRVFYFCLLIPLMATIRKSQFNIEILISWWFLHIYNTFQAL